MNLLPLVLALPPLADPGPIDFAKVPRTLQSQPTYVSEPRYGLLLFGKNGEHRMWAALDRSDTKGEAYDVLYLDLDCDGELGEEGERFQGTKSRGGIRFEIGVLDQPGEEKAQHTEFELTWTPASVRYKMMWRGKTLTMGCYGPTRDTYASFAPSIAKAPILVPGYDRPLEFEHWMSGTLKAGRSKDFKVFVGTRGSVRGAFTCGDEKLLPEGEYVLATLVYEDEDGKQQRVQAKLRERC